MHEYHPCARQAVSEEGLEAVVAVLRSDFLTQGGAVPCFEEKASGLDGARCAVAVASGTAAIPLAPKATSVGHGDRVWTSPITLAASANVSRYFQRDGIVEAEKYCESCISLPLFLAKDTKEVARVARAPGRSLNEEAAQS